MARVIGGCCGEHSLCGVAAQGVAMWFNTLVVWIVLFQRVQAAVYLNKWAVEILGGPDVANQVATDYGFRNLGQIGTLENYYLFEEQRLVKRSANPSRHHHFRLKKAPQVLWVEQQSVKRRFKREHKVELDRWKPKLNDPSWPEMWYLNQGARGGHDMNVIGAWRLGYTGKGVVVTILDDGIEYTHSDLQQNYDPKASFDINDSDDDPLPRYDKADENRHGTRCAGEVAAVANNSQCGVGVAFQAHIGGVRMLDGDVSDVVEAEALSLNPQYIDIYSASWGPEDNGKVVDGPATLAKEAFAQGIAKGRGGKGSIYIWASGNGGSVSDSCSCDGYANSIYTLSVSSSSEFGTKPWYLEECPSTLATTYSSGENYRERKIVTTDLHNRCIDNHTGTSASAPLAAGMCALALEANRNLTWRDMQYIVLMSARTEPLRDAQWVINGAGRLVSHRYGYGLMDGQAMVLLAEKWTTVPEQHVCPTDVIQADQQIEGSGISMTLDTNGCIDTGNEVNYLEHVQVKVSLRYSHRGDLQIHLISPNGTRSTLLPRRKYDYQAGEFRSWSFMSVFYWGEQPQGTWTLVLENIGSHPNSGVFESWELIMYGTKDDPINLKETTPNRPTVHIPAQGETTTDSDLSSSSSATLVKWNITEESATSTVTRTKPISTLKHKPKPGLKTTPKQTNKPTKTVLVKTKTTATKLVTVAPTRATLVENVTVIEVTTRNMTASFGWKEAVTDVVITVEDGVKTGETAEGANNAETLNGSEAVLNVTEKLQGPVSPNVTKSVSLTSVTTEEGTLFPFICDIECTSDGCSGPGAENCVACQHARLNGRCVNLCPNQTFYDSISGACLPCEPPCLECNGPAEGNRRNCRSCTDGHFFHMEEGLSDCLENCPLHYYADVGERTCIACSPNCLVCDDPSNCFRCADDFDLLDSNCVPACRLSEFRDEDGSCHPCDVSCETCVGPEAGDCASCASDRLQENDLCVSNCSEGYYIDLSDANDHLLTCQMCHPVCSTCFGPGDDECFSCYHPLKLYTAACVEDCPSGHFEDNDAICHACHEDCAACIGSQENDCLDCWPTRFYFDGRCAENCSEGLFPIEVFNHVTGGRTNRCELCHGTCQTCSGGSPVDCIRCFKGLVLSAGRCVAQCETNKYQEDDHCLECPEYCSACYGPLNDQCLECQTDHYLLNGQCLTDCPHGYYRLDGQCHSCSVECNGCSDYGPDNCFICSGDFVMHHGVCMAETIPYCSFGEFYNADELSCESCDDSCHTCSGRSQSQCLSCFAPKVLHVATGRCLPCCVDVDVSVDVPFCCTCDHVLGLCVELWNNLRPEVASTEHFTPADTRQHDISTSQPTTSASSIPSTETAPAPGELSSASEATSIPSSSVTTPLQSSHLSLPPVKPKSPKLVSSSPSKTTVSSPMRSPLSQTVQGIFEPLTKDSALPSDSENTVFSHVTKFLLSTTMATGDEITTATEEPGILSPWVMVLFLVLCLGTVCAVTFIVIFCCLQAKAGDKLCWSKRHYRQVPVFYRGAHQVAGGGKTVDATVTALRQV